MEARQLAVDLIGTTLDDRYRILGSLGKGGMGHVYAAVHMTLEQRVAIKVLHPCFAEVERYRARFLQEARAASRIHHPNVVEIKDYGRTPNGSVYFVMEYLRGRDMSVELQQHGALRWARVRSILLQAVGALRAAHAQQIIHRDIKPANCFLLDDEDTGVRDVVKLLDFGIAKVDSDPDSKAHRLPGNREVLGTASYMSPEQARNEPLDARSDMYSLGVMAYELLTGHVPFKGNNVLRLITAHLEEQPQPLRNLAPRVPVEVEALVLTMLAKAPADRYESMRALAHALRAIPETAGKRDTNPWCPTVSRRPTAGLQANGAPTRAIQPSGSHGGRRVGRGSTVTTAHAGATADASFSTQRKRSRIWLPPRPNAPGPTSSTDGASVSSLHGLEHEDRLGASSASLTALSRTRSKPYSAPGESPSAANLGSRAPKRASRISRGLALLGLLGLLVGGGSVIVTKVLFSKAEARKSLGTAERTDERAPPPSRRVAADPDAPRRR
jgi:serine/threonine protein kinase